MRKPVRVLVIAPFLWSGAGKAIVRLMLDLKSKGYILEMVSSGRSRGLSDWQEYVRALRNAGIPYHTIDFFDRDPERFWKSTGELTDLIRAKRIDLVHVHSGVPALAALVARDRLHSGFPVIATFHSWNPERPAWMNHADVWALNRCDHVITVSSSYQKELEAWGLDKKKCETIHLGVDMPAGRDSAVGIPSNGPLRVLSVGRLEPRKDQETLLRGFSLFRERFPEAELRLAGPVGDREYYERLRRKVRENGWEERVGFLGKVRNLDTKYRNADVFVSTSKDEGLGLAVLEAMSYGMPVICTHVAGHKDFVKDGHNAMVIPVGDFKRLAQTISKLGSDPGLRARLGKRARQTVRGRFSWPLTVRHYCDRFEKALRTRRANKAD